MRPCRQSNLKSCISVLIIFAIVCSQGVRPFQAQELDLPLPEERVPVSRSFAPLLLKGIKFFPDNPLRFDFIVDPGDTDLDAAAMEQESIKVIKYFLAAITIPEQDLWVNLSPLEKDRIIPEAFGHTEMGKDLLAQDYILKQLTASLIYPEQDLGQSFWEKVRQKAYEKYGTTEVPITTRNKVWIIPESASVYAQGDTIYITDAYLKVLHEKDYGSLNGLDKGFDTSNKNASDNDLDTNLSLEVFREVILPLIEKEVNEGENFTDLRQIYHAVILANWFKKQLGESLLGKAYADRKLIEGIDSKDKDIARKIFNRYLLAFKRGVYNYIKEEFDERTQRIIPRKYFSGGTFLRMTDTPIALLSDKEAEARVQNISKTLRISSELLPSSPIDKSDDAPESPAASAEVYQSDNYFKANDEILRQVEARTAGQLDAETRRLLQNLYFRKDSRFLGQVEPIDERDQMVILRTLLEPVQAGDKVVPRVIKQIQDLFTEQVETENISEIRVEVFNDEGLNKRVYLVDVLGNFKRIEDVDMIPLPIEFLPEVVIERFQDRLRIEQFEVARAKAGFARSFLAKVFRDPEKVDYETEFMTDDFMSYAETMGKRLQEFGRYPHISDDVNVVLESGRSAWVSVQGLVPGLSLYEMRMDLKQRFEEGLLGEDQYKERTRWLDRMAVKGYIKMWKILDGRFITDPKPHNIIIEGEYENAYHSVFFDLDKLTHRELSLFEVLKLLASHYGHGENKQAFMDGVQDGLRAWHSPEEIREIIEEVYQREIMASFVKYPALEQLLASYIPAGFTQYVPYIDKLDAFTQKVSLEQQSPNSSPVLAGESMADSENEPSAIAENLGGIDLTNEKINVHIQGKGLDLNFSESIKERNENMNLSGLTPMIFHITPVSDLSFELGIAE